MNIDNINKTIQRIKDDQTIAFFMGDWVDSFEDFATLENECGTACCLAGYAAVTEHGSVDSIPHNASYHDDGKDIGYTDYLKMAQDYFGISENTAIQLFIPDIGGHFFQTDKAIGIQVLEHLRDTGEVLWSKLPSCKRA